MKRNKVNAILLLVIQLGGYLLMLLVKWCHLAPFSELLHVSPWWDFTTTSIWAVMVALPAFYAYSRQLRSRWLMVGIAFLPIAIVLLLSIGGVCLHAYYAYNIQQARKQLFNTPEKIEQVAGVRLPAFHVTNYSEQDLHDALIRKHICRVDATFDKPLSDAFYHQLDSLCRADSLHWRESGGAYAYDSIYGRKLISKLVLSLVLMKGEKDFEIHYDDCVNFNINNHFKSK